MDERHSAGQFPRPRRVVKVTVSDGDHWTTSINGTESEIRDYFRIGMTINVGYDPVTDDRMRQITNLEFLE